MMKALVLIDVQNEFTPEGKRPIANIGEAIYAIRQHVDQARESGSPIAWIRHFNKPHESPAFVPDTWGADFIPGFGPKPDASNEIELHKDVYGAFTGTEIGEWLKKMGADEILLVGFYTHGCLSTTGREGIMAGYTVYLDPDATRSCAIEHPFLGKISEEESRKIALLQLFEMGASITNYSSGPHSSAQAS
jgi:nicotinamidase-related amidase